MGQTIMNYSTWRAFTFASAIGIAIGVMSVVILPLLAVPAEKLVVVGEGGVEGKDRVAFEGDIIESELSLQNITSNPIIIEEIRKSCGCLELFSDGVAITSPFTIDPNARLKCVCRFSTVGRMGTNVHTVGFRHKSGIANFRVSVHIQAPLTAFPAQVLLSDDERIAGTSAQVLLCDHLPLAKYRIVSTEVSNSAVQCEVNEENGERFDYAGIAMRKRCRLNCKLATNDVVATNAVITLHLSPINGGADSVLHVPVTIERSGDRVRSFPSEFTFLANAQQAERKATLKFFGAFPARIESLPKWCRAAEVSEVSSFDGRVVSEISLLIDVAERRVGECVFRSDGRNFVVPVTVR